MADLTFNFYDRVLQNIFMLQADDFSNTLSPGKGENEGSFNAYIVPFEREDSDNLVGTEDTHFVETEHTLFEHIGRDLLQVDSLEVWADIAGNP